MIDIERFNEILVRYKADFERRWSMQGDKEQYKWKAVKHFQDNWDVNAGDFGAMLKESLAKTENLLASAGNFPAGMITSFANSSPEETRSMFIALYDESVDLVERIKAFKDKAEYMLEKYGDGAKSHFQSENAITTYLWLRYPDRYYIYKYSEVREVAKELGSDYTIKKGAYANNIRSHLALYDEICKLLRADDEMASMLKGQIDKTPGCYSDPEMRTLTVDFGFFTSRYIADADNPNEESWFPSKEEYDPGISVLQWRQLLGDEGVFTESALQIVSRLKDYGGAATCTQLAQRYGETANFYISGSVALAKRIAERTGCRVMGRDSKNSRWWPILYVGRYASGHDEGSYIWRLRDELSEALDMVSEDEYPVDETPAGCDPYTKEDFLGEVFMTESRYDHLVAVLRNKKNVILQGAPGVGKTFAANRLAWSMMGSKDESRIEFVQFHQSYSYEDFMMGYKPDGEGFELKYGVFYRFCQKAANQPDKEFFFIIDEINRGNMSKIFGELLMLIECDYRGKKAALAYNGLPFSVPENLFIIGMMNTADRSLAMIDYALRRRFSFFEMEPGFDTEGFSAYQESLGNETLDELVDRVKELNGEIARDRTLGKGFCIGHSYFCGREECTEEWLHEVVEYDILPMLSEYWFDDAAKLARWENILRGVLAR